MRVLGGLMALGYEIGAIMRRTTAVLKTEGGDLMVKVDDIEGLGRFVQVGVGGRGVKEGGCVCAWCC